MKYWARRERKFLLSGFSLERSFWVPSQFFFFFNGLFVFLQCFKYCTISGSSNISGTAMSSIGIVIELLWMLFSSPSGSSSIIWDSGMASFCSRRMIVPVDVLSWIVHGHPSAFWAYDFSHYALLPEAFRAIFILDEQNHTWFYFVRILF